MARPFRIAAANKLIGRVKAGNTRPLDEPYLYYQVQQ